MSDLFISYSRDDSSFVRRLHSEIDKVGLNAWVDYDDIPKAEPFWEEIKKGIDAANSFVFILSPSSVEKSSNKADNSWCRKEIEYAAKQSKRIIPIVYQKGFQLNREMLAHQILGERNWIFFTGDDFEVQFRDLLRTIETDINYVEKHTELTVAAEKWNARGRKDKSLLWHGKRLMEAEKWLRDGKMRSIENGKKKYPDPAPTSLQESFVSSSRKYVKLKKLQIVSLLCILVPIVETFLREQAVKQDFDKLSSTNQIDKRKAIANLVEGCPELKEWRKELLFIGERRYGNCRPLLNSSLDSINLSGISPSGGYTEGIDLQNVKFDGSTLRNVSNSKLNNSFLNGSNLSGSDLSSTDLRDSALSAIFANANLNHANLKNSNLAMAKFNGANLYYANLSDTNLYGTTFDRADLSYANFSNAKDLTVEQIKLARLCETQLPSEIDVDPDRDCSVKSASQPSSKQSTELSLKATAESTNNSHTIEATDSFTPQNNCKSNVPKKGRCRITRTYQNGKWSGATVHWSDDVETNIIIETVNPGNRMTSTHGNAKIDGKPGEYFTFSDGGICFRILEDNSSLCYR
jgi:uncharacterized protein YjbI with pentapeptide repeats